MSHRLGDSSPFSSSAVVALTLLLVVVPLGLILSLSALPPGADPGLMLAISYALEGNGPEGALNYPPGLPFVMLLFRRVSGDDTALLLLLVKALGVTLLLFEAVGLGAYTGAVCGRRAGLWTFVLAALDPNAWNQLLWGGYAQFFGVGAGASSLAFLHLGLSAPPTRGRRHLAFAGGFMGLVVLTHMYSAPFFLGAAVALSVLHASRSGRHPVMRRALAAGGVMMVVALPSVVAYRNIAQGTYGMTLDPALRWQSYSIAIAEVVDGIFFHPAVNALMLVTFLSVLAVRGQYRLVGPSPSRTGLLPFLVGTLFLTVSTPPLHIARAGLFACHGVVVWMGATLGQSSFPGLFRRSLLLPGSALVLVLLAVPWVSYRDLAAQHRYYAPFDMAEIDAMKRLGTSATGRVLVVSPSPNLDGWWFQGLTGRAAAIGDRLRWYMYTEQRTRSIDAQSILHSSQLMDGGSLKLLTLSSPGEASRTSLWVLDDEEYYPLLQLSALLERDGGASPGTPHLETMGDRDGFELRWIGEAVGEPQHVRLVIEAFPEGLATIELHHRRLTVDCEFFYASYRSRGMARTVTLEARSLENENAIAIEGSAHRTEIRARSIAIRGRVDGVLPGSWQARDRRDLLQGLGVTHVLVRDEPPGHNSLETDSRFERMWRSERVSAFRVLN